ncbi:hypothetical protein N9W07_00150 [Alphaproteobacteria bacterium]|nr:hypothetical protein [Alphaproteobacteria bacterium]
MAQALPIITLAIQHEQMNDQEEQNRRQIDEKNIINEQKQKEQKEQIRRNLATRRARQYADGYTGRTYQGQLGRINKSIKKPLYNRVGSGGNTLNRINLFAKTLKQMGIE